jgi:hypothetical protein
MTARGLRNNNPGNIVQSGIEWRGKVVPSTDPRFETFDTPHNGIRAAAKLLLSYQDKHGLRTVRGIINRWAPPAENDTGAYINIVAGELGVHADDQIDLHRFTTLVPLVSAIIRHENGEQPYAAELIAAAVSDALEVEAPVPDTPAPVTPEIPANTSAPEPVNPIASPGPVALSASTATSATLVASAVLRWATSDGCLPADF